MNLKTYIFILLSSIFAVGLQAEDFKEGKTLFEDKFDAPELKKEWTIEEGEWSVKKGWLLNRDGGIISMKKPCGETFILEADIRISQYKALYPWVSIVFSYTDKDNRTELFITPGERYYYLQTIENGDIQKIAGKSFPFTRKDIHKLRIAAFYNTVSFFWDGKLIVSEKVNSSESKIAFIGCQQGADFEIKNVCIKELLEEPLKTVKNIDAGEFTKSQTWNDYKFKCPKGSGNEVAVDKATAFLSYDFSDSKDFRGTFLRLPVNVESAKRICLNVEGDGSRNKFFIIVHDKSGEQHLVESRTLSWDGAHEIKVDIQNFLVPPPERVIEATHWDGDKNQKIDFPITALDIGVCSREKAIKQSGRIGISDLHFEE